MNAINFLHSARFSFFLCFAVSPVRSVISPKLLRLSAYLLFLMHKFTAV